MAATHKTWKAAREIALNKRGSYPFNRKEKESLLASLKSAGEDVEALHGKGLLTEVEAKLLKGELTYLTGEVSSYRSTEMKGATCYKPMPIQYFTNQRVDRIIQRLPLLEKIANSRTIHPEAASKILSTIEMDISGLKKEEAIGSLDDEERKKAEDAVKKAKIQIDRIKKRL